jgi:monofunctional glycosyltransferase
MNITENLEWIKKNGLKYVLRLFIKITIWFVGLSLFFVVLFKWVPVPVTPLMLIRTTQQIDIGTESDIKT